MSAENNSSRSAGRRKHLLLIIPAAVGVLLASGWFGVTFAVENTARRCLADASARLLGQAVKPDEVSFSLVRRELSVRGIRVDNPRGYSQEHALKVERIRIQVDPSALLFKRVVHLKQLTVSGIRVNVELKKTPLGLDGWLDLLSDPEVNLLELKKSTPVSERNTVERKKRSGSRRSKRPLKFRIDELRVERGEASLHNYTIIPERLRTLALKSYAQKDLGRENPLTADELAVEIFRRHWDDIKKYVRDETEKSAARLRLLFKRKSKKEKTSAQPPAPASSAAPVQPENEAAKKQKSEARRKLLREGGRAAAELAGNWLKRKKQEIEKTPSASGDPEEDRKARRNKRLVDLGLQAADAARKELAAPPGGSGKAERVTSNKAESQ